MKELCRALLLGCCASGAIGAPYLPGDDAAVLERLPLRRADPAAAELRKLQASAAARPDDPAAAAALARRYFELAMAQGDPRYVGYAEGALRSWRAGEAPADVLFIRGLLKQYRHDFSGRVARPRRRAAARPRAHRRALRVPADRIPAAAYMDVSADDFRRRFRADRGDRGALDG